MPDFINLTEKLNALFNNELEISEDKQSVVVKKEQLLELMRVLKDDIKYIMLADITAVDYNDYFELIYHVMNTDADLLEIKARLEKDHADMPSLTSVWKAADVQEREIYDLMGISFSGHGNLKRILCKDDFEGHPLRKDFKLDIVSRF
jgi:NADH-quinone oxidoreductase subunit C